MIQTFCSRGGARERCART